MASAVVTAIAALTIDKPLARLIDRYQPLALWDRGIDLLEWVILLPLWKFALPVGLVLGMVATATVAAWRGAAPAWMFVAGVHLASRLTVNWIKDATGRFRPTQWLASGWEDSFGWVSGISFPSGHVVLFASLAFPIAILWPRRWVIAAAATTVGFVATARIAVNAHFVSDALGAITLAAWWTWLIGGAVRPLRSSRR